MKLFQVEIERNKLNKEKKEEYVNREKYHLIEKERENIRNNVRFH